MKSPLSANADGNQHHLRVVGIERGTVEKKLLSDDAQPSLTTRPMNDSLGRSLSVKF